MILTDTEPLGLFEDIPGIRVLTPAQCAGAATTAEEHVSRFHDLEVCKAMAQDIVLEDNAVRERVEELRLEHWVNAARAKAQSAQRAAPVVEKEIWGKISDMIGVFHDQQPQLRSNQVQDDDPQAWGHAVQHGRRR